MTGDLSDAGIPGPQLKFRGEVLDVPTSAFASSAAPGSVRTYEAALKSVTPKVTSKVGYQIFPMRRTSSFVGPRFSASSAGQLVVCWSYVELVEAAVAFWRSVRGILPVFEKDCGTHIGAFWAGLKKACSDAHREKGPLPLPEKRSVLERALFGASIHCGAVGTNEYGEDKTGLGRFLTSAVELRAATPMAAGFFAARRLSEIARLATSDVIVEEKGGSISGAVDQLGVGQLAYLERFSLKVFAG